jgi:hypothetical protein
VPGPKIEITGGDLATPNYYKDILER